ncbi:MAG: homoserine O-acetyltransferase, partial [Candidatus Omnitrophica bacterium]|nr:homoserine O-acetyltransferase [Candidatus Omnitrophota bacterium]
MQESLENKLAAVTGMLESSDSIRHARPLRYLETVSFDVPFKLEKGGVMPGITVAYETYGRLSAAKDNAILVCHAISGDSHVARHNDDDDPGWWDIMVGPGKPIDTNRYFVVCPNVFGGCRGTTGPGSVQPATGKPYGNAFPTVTIGDMVEVQRMLLDHLGIPQLLAVTGGSLGGHQALAWAVQCPERVRGAALLATSARLTSQALAFDVVGRNAIRRDPYYHGGQYYDRNRGPEVGLAIARMIGHITYLSPEAMTRKFDPDRLRPREVATKFEKTFSVGSYLGHQGTKFVERFDANSYITLSMALDLFDLGGTPAELAAALSPARCRWLILSFSSDWLFPPEQSRDLVDALVHNRSPVSYCTIKSACGHDAFLLSDDFASYGEMLRAFLNNLECLGPDDQRLLREDSSDPGPTSIFPAIGLK